MISLLFILKRILSKYIVKTLLTYTNAKFLKNIAIEQTEINDNGPSPNNSYIRFILILYLYFYTTVKI